MGKPIMSEEREYQDWRKRYDAAEKRDVEFVSQSSAEVEPLYTPRHLPGFDPSTDLGMPGSAPFTRGIHPTMYRGRLWTMRQFAGFGTAEDTNQRYKFLLARGQTGLSVAFDFPTLMGDRKRRRVGKECGA